MSICYADIIIDISHEKVDRPFQYRIPESLLDAVKVGVRVTVPFGNFKAAPWFHNIINCPRVETDKR